MKHWELLGYHFFPIGKFIIVIPFDSNLFQTRTSIINAWSIQYWQELQHGQWIQVSLLWFQLIPPVQNSLEEVLHSSSVILVNNGMVIFTNFYYMTRHCSETNYNLIQLMNCRWMKFHLKLFAPRTSLTL